MKLKLALIAVILIVPFCVQAETMDIKISGDITNQGVTRNLTLGGGRMLPDPVWDEFGRNNLGIPSMEDPKKSEDFGFTQSRVQVEAELTDSVTAKVRLIDELIWGATSTNVAVDLAYVEMKDVLNQSFGIDIPVDVTVGRQNLRYGNGMIIGDPDTNGNSSDSDVPMALDNYTLRKAFEASKVVLGLDPWTVDIIYAQVHEGTTNVKDDVILRGAYVDYLWSNTYGNSQFYFFNCDHPPGQATLMGLNALLTGHLDWADRKDYVNVIGSRIAGYLSKHFILDLEAAYQFGDYRRSYQTVAHAQLEAWAANAIGVWKFNDERDTSIAVIYGFRSGDDPCSKGYEGWNPLFEDSTPGEILNIATAGSNGVTYKLVVTTDVTEDIKFSLAYLRAYLAEKIPDEFSNAEGAFLRYKTETYSPPSGALSGTTWAIDNRKRHVGDEVDATVTYDFSEDVELKIVGGWLFPGTVFDSENDSPGYSLRSALKVNF